MKTRFAPSPTGFLHIGNVRTALVCYLYARKTGGEFFLRLDDTDLERSSEEFAKAIEEDLLWLGLKWDQKFRQSERLARYEEVKRQLIASGRLYACYESQEELEIKRKMQLSRGQPPIYDRAALKLSAEEKAKLEAEGKRPHYRFKMEEKPIIWQDEIRGEVRFEGKNISDPIVIRATGDYTYMLPSTIDDVDYAMTHIVRGEDHVSNTATQIQMFEALGAKIPTFAHMPLLKTKEGKLSKREGGFDIRGLRAEGIEALAITSYLARVGTSAAIDLVANLETMVQEFDIAKLGQSTVQYDPEEIHRLNAKMIHKMSFAEAQAKLQQKNVQISEDFWRAVQPNITRLEEVGTWWRICKEQLTPPLEDREFTVKAAELLPSGNLEIGTWDVWIESVKKETGKKGKELFMPIRKALTGMEHGPELKHMLPLIGREKAVARLMGKAA